MQTINNRMTETQIADLFSLAVQLQVKAEESEDRDTAILAYSIQNACSNLTESRREFRAADATIHNLELKITDMAVQLANAESKCREMAAENAGLKNGNGTAIEFRDFYAWWNIFNEDGLRTEDERMLAAGAWMARSGLGNTDTYQYVPAATTATDDFLAEVRAQGVEMFAHDVGEFEQGNGLMKAIGRRAIKFAAQLRKGAAL